MNARHSQVTDWGLKQVSIEKNFTVLDVGCGGGRTVGKLAAVAADGKVYGLDFSGASVAVAKKTNRDWIKVGRVEIRDGSVSEMPFAADTFDLVVAVETHFWWPDLRTDLREVLRVLKPGGTVAIIAEVYKRADTATSRLVESHLPAIGMNLLTQNEHRDLLAEAGFTEVEVAVKPGRGWIFAAGKKSWTRHRKPNPDSTR